MNKRTLAILAALTAAIIYALNHTIAKEVMPTYIKPYGFILLRVMGATILFWSISFLIPKEKIARSDWGRLLICSLLGMVINMLTFFKGLELSTPINSAVLITLIPIVVVVLSALFINEKVTIKKAVGILLGLVGAIALVVFGSEARQDATNITLGNTLLIINPISYGIYLILSKKLIEKYHPFTLMKWLFTIAIFINFPITYTEFSEVQWEELPLTIVWRIVFVVFGTTFLAYLFISFALTQLKASTVGAFVYLQPLIGILFALAMGKDNLTTIKVAATVLILLGVYLSSIKPKKV